MISKKTRVISSAILLVAALFTGSVESAPINVPNGDFENWQAIGDGGATNQGWQSVPTGFTPATNVGRNDEMWTNPSSFGSGWQSNGPVGTAGPYGLQHPSAGQHQRSTVPGPLTGPRFSGNFIGFLNAPASGDQAGIQQAQSGILGNLQAGTYTLTTSIGARPVANWNDTAYRLALVADPVLGAPNNGGPALGSRDGVVLGTAAAANLVPSTAALGTNQQDLTYTLTLGAGDPNVGRPFAIRIEVENTLMANGVENLTQFTQGNFDNVLLDFVAIPEPGTVALFITAALFGAASMRRRIR